MTTQEIQKPKLLSKIWRLNNLYKIVDKKWECITFKPNFAQKKLREVEIELRNKSPIWKYWINTLKWRQLWISTYKLVDWLDIALFYRNRTVVIVWHKKEKLKDLFQKVKFAYEQLPDKIKTPKWYWYKPKAKYDNVNEYYFPETNSTIKVTLDARSWTATDLHITELAFRRDWKEMMRWTIPAAENANVSIETTANWIANYYYELWSKWKDKISRFYNFFLPWFYDPGYQTPLLEWEEIILPDELKHLDFLTKAQQKLYIELYKEDPEWALQEYPTTPDEAFISSWRPVFNLNTVRQIKEKDYEVDEIFKEIHIFRRPWFKAWTQDIEPINCNYGWDVAEWLVDWDYSTIVVLDEDHDVLATYKWHIPPDELPKIIDRLHTLWYKWVQIWIERNNHWLTTITHCKNYSWYKNLFHEKTLDKNINKTIRKPWFLTTWKSKPLIIDMLEEYIRKGWLWLCDARIIKECFTYYYDERWRSNAISPNHDDLIMALAIALFMTKQPKKIIFG